MFAMARREMTLSAATWKNRTLEVPQGVREHRSLELGVVALAPIGTRQE